MMYQLKKLIKDVVNELTSMGLSHDVLHKLLVTEDEDTHPKPLDTSSIPVGNLSDNTPTPKSEEDDQGDVLEFEFESDESSPQSTFSPTFHSHTRSPKEVALDPILVDDDDLPLPIPESQIAGPSSLPTNATSVEPHHSHHRKFRLRLLSDVTPEKPAYRPMGVSEMLKMRTEPVKVGRKVEKKSRKVKKHAIVDGHGGVKAEYVLAGKRYIRLYDYM
jgi:hypothetical protein